MDLAIFCQCEGHLWPRVRHFGDEKLVSLNLNNHSLCRFLQRGKPSRNLDQIQGVAKGMYRF